MLRKELLIVPPLVLLACQAAQDAGDVLIDAGHAMEDAGRWLADAGVGSDAQAQEATLRTEVYETTCVDGVAKADFDGEGIKAISGIICSDKYCWGAGAQFDKTSFWLYCQEGQSRVVMTVWR